MRQRLLKGVDMLAIHTSHSVQASRLPFLRLPRLKEIYHRARTDVWSMHMLPHSCLTQPVSASATDKMWVYVAFVVQLLLQQTLGPQYVNHNESCKCLLLMLARCRKCTRGKHPEASLQRAGGTTETLCRIYSLA